MRKRGRVPDERTRYHLSGLVRSFSMAELCNEIINETNKAFPVRTARMGCAFSSYWKGGQPEDRLRRGFAY